MTEAESTIVAAVLGAVVAILGGLAGWWLTYWTAKRQHRQKADDLFLTALDFMGGGTQRRNLGIAAITMYWQQFPDHKKLCADMLIGSAIYLLTESKQKDASHEAFNLGRIIDLINQLAEAIPDRGGYDRLKAVLVQRIDPYEPKPRKGLWIAQSQLETWRDTLPHTTRGERTVG